jgi:hypothetical protein
VDAQETHTHEFLGQIFDFFQTDNLPVKLMAIASRIAAKDDQKRLARFLGEGACRVEVVMPTLLRRHFGRRALRDGGGGKTADEDAGQEESVHVAL